jgi:putative SOS response-associated peptidase YedK
MCGRYERHSDKQKIADAFKVGKLPPGFELPPDYNVAPQTFQPVVRLNRETGERELTLMRWGLVPYWAMAFAGLWVCFLQGNVLTGSFPM